MGFFDRFKRSSPRIRVRGVLDPTVHFESTAAADLASLDSALRTGDSSGAICMCPGTLLVEVEGRPAITLHHGTSLRWDGSNGNEPLVDPDAMMDWLSERGMTFVREEYEASRAQGERNLAAFARWKNVMPFSLLPFFDEMRSTGGTERPEWTAAFEAEVPDVTERARRLLAWFGSGEGPWSGYGSYEAVPEALLLKLPLPVLLAAIGDDPVECVREGAARLFTSWSFGRERKKDRARVPAPLVALLRAHVAGDADKRATFAAAFR